MPRKRSSKGYRTASGKWWDYWKARGRFPKKSDDGYHHIPFGKVRAGDMVWDVDSHKFVVVTPAEVDTPVTNFHFVQRKTTIAFRAKMVHKIYRAGY